MTQDISSMMTMNDAAEVLGITAKSVGRLLRQGKIKGQKIGKTWATTPAYVEQYKLDRATRIREHGMKRAKKPPIITNPKRKRRKILADDRPNMRRVHARADRLVAARREFLMKKFPKPRPGEVYEYVLHNMPPQGLREKDFGYEDDEVYA